MFAVTQTSMSAADQGFTWTWGVMVAVAVTMAVPRRISIHVDLRSSLSRTMGTSAGIFLSTRATGTPAMPDIIALGTVMDEDKEAEGDGEGTVKAAEDHAQEEALRHR